MSLGANIQIRAVQIIDYLVYMKVQRTSNLADMCSHTPHSTVNKQNTVQRHFLFRVSHNSTLCTGDKFSCV